MSESGSEPSLAELIRLALPGDYRVLAGSRGMQGALAWVSAVTTASAREIRPTPREFVLLLPPYENLLTQCKWLSANQCAGVALLHTDIPRDLLNWADANDFPILALAPATDLQQFQRRLLTLILDRASGVIARQAEIYQHLTRLSAENRGLGAMAQTLCEVTQKGIVIQDKRLQVLASSAPSHLFANWDAVVAPLAARANLPSALFDRKRAAEIRQALEQNLADASARLVMPITVQGVARGFLSIVAADDKFDLLDRIAIEQGAAACGLEMAKVKAVSETRKRLTGDLIEGILNGSLTETDSARWAERAGYRRSGAYGALVMQWVVADAPTLRRLETIVNGENRHSSGRAIALAREQEIVVFFAASPERAVDDMKKYARRIYETANAEFPRAYLAIGIGRPSKNLLGLRQSYHEAEQAMMLEHKLRQHRPQYFGDLGVFRLLLHLEGNPDLNSFAITFLGKLLEYDRTQSGNLIETLTIYFQHNANLAQTAEALFIHRNTLLYRMARIQEISGLDLEDPETRLGLQLALRVHQLIAARDE